MSQRRSAGLRAAMGALAFGVFGTACLQPTTTGPGGGSMSGAWRYSAMQTDPVREAIDGTLTFLDRVAGGLDGRLDMRIVTSATGATRLASGVTAGVVSGNVVDFDVSLATGVRRHVGHVVADTMSGTWIETSLSGGGAASGSFRAERRTQ